MKDGSNKPIWKSCCGAILLPDLVLDTSARVPPVGADIFSLLKLDKLVSSPVNGTATDSMDTSASVGPPGEVSPRVGTHVAP